MVLNLPYPLSSGFSLAPLHVDENFHGFDNFADQVHDKGEEGEWWWKQRVWVKELDCKVQACISEEEKYGQILEVTTMHT